MHSVPYHVGHVAVDPVLTSRLRDSEWFSFAPFPLRLSLVFRLTELVERIVGFRKVKLLRRYGSQWRTHDPSKPARQSCRALFMHFLLVRVRRQIVRAPRDSSRVVSSRDSVYGRGKLELITCPYSR